MPQQIINIGTVAGDGTGDALRESQRKTNENFSEIYTRYAENLGVVTPTDTPTGTGINYWDALVAGTYTNFGGVVLGANSRGLIFRNLSGVFSITQTTLDLTGKVNVSDVINTLVSTETAKPLSAAQGKALNDKFSGYAKSNDLTNKADLIVAKNLFNWQDADVLINSHFGVGGTTVYTGSNMVISGYIPVIAGQTYICNKASGGYADNYYNAEKVYLSSSTVVGGLTTAPTGAFYIRKVIGLNAGSSVFNGTATIQQIQFELGSTSTLYETYTKSVQPIQLNLKDYTKTNDLALQTAFDTRLKADLVQSKNLFNKATTTDNFYLNTANGTLTSLASLFVSDFIAVSEGLQYYFNTTRLYTCFYDKNKNFVSGSTSNFALTIPVGVRYIRVTGDVSNKNTHQFELGSTATGYENYSIKFDNLTFDKVPSLIISKNLFITETSAANSFINWTTGLVQGSYPTGIASDFIPVVAGSIYSCNSTQTFKAFYDSNKSFISGSQSGTYPVTIPAGCSFIRITIGAAQKYNCQFELGSTQTPYVVGGYNSKYPYYSDEPIIIKKLVTIGDSITAMNMWQPKLVTKLNLSHTNLGIGGTILSGGTDGGAVGDGYWTTQRVATIPTDTDIIILNGGINDYARNVVIGVIGSTNTSEFYGALNKWVERVIARVPNAKIFIASTTYGEYGSYSADPNYANAGGNTSKEYATAMKNIAYKYGFPVIDFQGCCMVNKWNRIALAPDGLHPELEYADRMSNIAIDVMANLK